MVEPTARKLRVLGDPTRLRILHLLAGRRELCVCELVEALRLPQYAVSRHLSALRQAGLVSGWREGKWMHYAISERLSAADRRLVRAVSAAAAQDRICQQDSQRLSGCLRPRGRGGRIACP